MKTTIALSSIWLVLCAMSCLGDTNDVPGSVLVPNGSLDPGRTQQVFQVSSTNFPSANFKPVGHVVLKSPTSVGLTGEIEVQANGAMARFAQHKALFATNPNPIETVPLSLHDGLSV